MTTLSFAFSLRFSSVTSTSAVAPAGITAPFEPVIELVTVAVKWSPTLLVLVQTFEPDVRLSVEPAAIVSVFAPAAFPGVPVTVFPLDVTEVVGLRVVVGVRVVVVVRVVVRAVVAGAGVLAVPAGTSVRAGCAAVSRFASWMSLLRAESAAALLSVFAVQAAKSSATESASDALVRGIY